MTDEHVHEVELVDDPPPATIDTNLIKGRTNQATGRTEVKVRLSADGQNLAKAIAAHYGTNWLTVVYALLHRELTEVEAMMARAKGAALDDAERAQLALAKHALSPG
jgi:hypothetical protein